jgi:hypothetical protein
MPAPWGLAAVGRCSGLFKETRGGSRFSSCIIKQLLSLAALLQAADGWRGAEFLFDPGSHEALNELPLEQQETDQQGR